MNDTYSNYSLFEQTYSNVSKPSNNTLKKQMIAQIFFMIVHQSVIMAVSLLGNLFLLFVIFRGNRVMKRRVSPVQLLILHTCVADLLFVFLSLGTEILTLMAFPNYYGSNFTCKFMRYVQMFPMYASPFLLVAISADRYQAICRPLAHFRSSRYRRPNWMAAIAWGLALLLSVPQFFVWTKNGKTGRCSTVYGVNRNIIKSVYVIMFNTLAWLLPSIFAAFFYYCVCKAVRLSSNKSVRAMDSQKKNGKQSTEATENYIEELRKKSKGFRQQMSEFDRKRVQTVRLTITIVACNFFLWMPFCIINVIQALWPDVLSPAFINNVSVLGNLNSCLNPWIYILFNRSHVKKALCQSRGTSEPTTKRSLVNFDTSTATNNNNNNHNSTQSNSLNHHCNHRSNFKYKRVHQRSHSTDCTSFR
ncbi:Protein CBG07660 [Caenorhabditis briggsae]|uniref:Protein CBG07660 n=1 Tax=Caenorhabditis briggsae TaxID=6238 RepID=A8X4C5_CAEBR|nr:Protein CBG07660 [Caenorhabditis briggsae]CAP27485.1 Protein CBG07660 [Caenorhabditis briggsae]